ncbi:hypothetical protein [Methanoculleus sp.]|jgi:hypothetical protein|uniref:hypothetical protein n=1 Tax=Methanoculleus sp. TaxID=90427 RepID=UPI0025D65581|nr:hypothetical protein [Methanoculleus sp.]MCK9319495.1 hypothetical protein [Methanoculleus sp.]
MQDYHIYTHYIEKQNVSQTSPKYEKQESNTKAAENLQKEKSGKLNIGTARKAAAVGLAVVSKINSYVGEYTENTVQASRRKTALAYAAFGLGATANPMLAVVGATIYTADKMINYSIKVNKENLSADFARQLSGGVVRTRG